MNRGAPSPERIAELAGGDPLLVISGLHAGYGKMEILHGVDLMVAAGRSLCMIGPNGAGKSTVLHSIYGFTRITSGSIRIGREDNSVFPDMTVEENLWMGGYLMEQPAQAKEAAERVFDKYPQLAARRRQLARVLSGGERRLLEISRALVMDPRVLLVDEPSIGLEPRFIDIVFEILSELQHGAGKAIVVVEQNARKGLQFADVGYVLVSGSVARVGSGAELLEDPEIGRLYLGG
ncbi:MAG: ATP-binding cassette domain-containing protein [Deltaproteobacteria bacterium]|nr:MAG: ATP-binding cassette domain-containing protein [Deltaproteobacteria bacterium]